ncbi:protein phosphatase 1 regulatory subunit 12A-like isoform X2 [Liolophura sinensis]|uniref:protein phosphatase 1 regulatory subunit 12A-like isoform X2 n=1 Tax=Liolophura sinensis TaxID=3198878 RepID=UPI0031589113
MAEGKGYPNNALFRRHEQLERWKGSATDLEPSQRKRPDVSVKFADGCMFLAACSSADIDEVKSFLDRGADINTANIDGLTALHQACIDQNMNMVQFLVENNADVNVCDNEGWTPLHATASCGFAEIARYLIECGADVASVNNDGDLPIDICEDQIMEELLQAEMDKQGIDAEAARKAEEEMMLADANQWLNNRTVKEKPHAQTGATALHVASAKGYVNVMKVLIQANANLNAADADGWTPLHAAAHWGQEEACKLLAESLCDMEIKNNAGQTAFDVADQDVHSILEELKKRQATLREKADISDIIQTKGPGKRRSSVTRMSGGQKQNVMLKTSEQEKAVLVAEEKTGNSSSSSSEGETTDSETDKQNAINKKEKLDLKVNHPQEPGSVVTETAKTDMTRIEESPESSKSDLKPPEAKATVSEGVPSLLSESPERLSVRWSLHKTGSSSMLPDNTYSEISPRGRVLRSVSSSRIPHDSVREQTTGKETVLSSTEKTDIRERSGLSSGVSFQPRVYNSSYVPYYRRKIEENKAKLEKDKQEEVQNNDNTVAESKEPAKEPVKEESPPKDKEETKSPEITSNLSDGNKKEPTTPTRTMDSTANDEAELKRKARAKRSRETRRPTQGVTRDDIVKAEAVLRATREKEEEKTPSSIALTTTTTTTDATKEDIIRRPRTLEERKEDESRGSVRRSRNPDLSSSTSSIPTRTSESSTITQHTPVTRNSLMNTVSNSEPSLTGDPVNITRSASLRRSRNLEPEKVEEEKKEEKKEENKEQTKLKSRRRRERRPPTGIIDLNNPNNESKDETEEKKEEKKEEESKDERTGFSSRGTGTSSRYKSTSSLDTDYKKMYEGEKMENEKLKKDLAQTKRDLEQAQRELERALRKRDSDVKQEKRSLERKVSELEEELKKMREDNERVKQENQALIRVISRLSR